MDELLKKYNDYMRLKDCLVVYELENGLKIEVAYKEENFLHLLGIHKLKDIQLVQFWLDRSIKTVKMVDVLKHIKNETFTDKMVKASHFYETIKTRYEKFNYDNLTTLNYTDAIINFDSTIINSMLKSDYILFEKQREGGYNHMGIALSMSESSRYVETFFYEPSEKYIKGQTIVKIKKFSLFDSEGKIIITDTY